MPDAATTLYLFPHAGGSVRYYIPFSRAFTDDIRRVAVQYPGRAGSHDLAGFTGIEALAGDACRRIRPDAPSTGRVAFFGHSMGSLVAFEVARRFEAAGRDVAALFVSACAAPGHVGYETISDSDRGLLDAVSMMTGANPEYLEDSEFSARILPTLRGLKAITNYRCDTDAAVACPIHAYFGESDVIADAEKVGRWADRTENRFTLTGFDGHHFYLDDHAADLARAVTARLAED